MTRVEVYAILVKNVIAVTYFVSQFGTACWMLHRGGMSEGAVTDCPHCVFVSKVEFWYIFWGEIELWHLYFIKLNNNSIFIFQFIDCIMCKYSQLYSKISQACIVVNFTSLFSYLCLYQFLFLSVLLVWRVNILAFIQWAEFKWVPAHQKYPNLVAHMAEM